MSSINEYIYDELFIKIFSYLQYEERLICRIVCQKWLELLMTDFTFRNDRQLFLSNCFIHPKYPPASVLLSSNFLYETLTISKSALKWLSYEDEAKPFFEFLGQSVTKMHLVDFGVDNETFKVFKEFPFLDILIMNDEGTFFNAKDLEKGAFKNLEKLEVRKFTDFDDIFELPKVAPNLKYLNFQEFDFLKVTHYENLVKFNDAYPGLLESFYVRSFLAEDNKSLEVSLVESVQKSSNISRIIHNQSNNGNFSYKINEISSVKEIFLSCNQLTAVSMTKITVLKLSCLSLRDISPLEALINLEKFQLEVIKDSCYFGHQILYLKKVKKFKFCVWNTNCDDCFLTLSKSFPNLQEFSLCTLSLNSSLRGKIRNIFNWPHLKKMQIRPSTIFCATPIENELLNVAPCRKLTHLTLENNIIIDKNAIKHLSSVCPNLVRLKFHVESTSPSIVTIMEELLTALTNLAVLQICPSDVSFFNVTEKEASLILDIIIQHGKNLRDLTIPTHYKTNHNHAMKLLFEKLPNLSFIQMKEMDSRRYGYVMSRVNKYLIKN